MTDKTAPGSYTVRILKVGAGEVRSLQKNEMESLWLAQYAFESGNYSCDCNRAILFHRAGTPGMSGEEAFRTAPDVSCGEGGYLVQLVDHLNGNRIIWQDGAFPPF